MTLRLNGTTSGYVEIDSAATSSNHTIVLPSSNGTANQFLKNGSTAGTLGWSSLVEDASGRLLVGTSTARNNFFNASVSSALNVEISTDNGIEFAGIRNRNDANGGVTLLAKSRGTTAGSNTIVQSGDELGRVSFQGSDGTEFVEGAFIQAQVDGTPGANDMPGRLVFSTTADGASSPTERMRIFNNGNVSFFGGLGIGLGSNVTNNQGSTITVSSNVLGSGAGTHFIKWSNTTGVLTFDTSSRLVKEDIVDCPYGIDALKLLQPRKYFRNDDQREEIGFIADEVVQVMPEFVPLGPKSLLTKNEDDAEEIPVGVNYDRLTAVLTKALQEAIAKIETLEAANAALETRLAALEAQQ